MAQPARAAAAVSTRNPPPCDLGEAVMKIDLNGSVRARTDDERTEAGVDESHTFFIVPLPNYRAVCRQISLSFISKSQANIAMRYDVLMPTCQANIAIRYDKGV